MVTTKAVKSTALIHLKGNWAKACAVGVIPTCATMAVILISYLLSLPLGSIISNIISVFVFTFMVAPLWLGTLRFFWRMANNCADDTAEVFHYLSSKKSYFRSLSFNLIVLIHWAVKAILLFLPIAIIYYFTSGMFFELIGSSVPVLLINLRYLIYPLLLAAFIVIIVHLISLYLPAFLFVTNEDMSATKCFNRGIEIGKYTKNIFTNHALSFIGWILLSCFLIPLIFTLPFLIMLYIVECRYNVAFYNLSGKAAFEAPTHEL